MRYEEDFSGMANDALVRTITGTEIEVNTSLRDMSNMTIQQLTRIKGVGEKTARKLLAAFELGRRLLEERADRNDIGSSLAIYQRLRPMMEQREIETAYLLVMNQDFKELACVKLSEGGITETAIDVRVIMKNVVLNNGTVIALAHYHPGGNPRPSKADDLLTSNIKKACDVMRVFFMDHVILANGTYYSYHDHGRYDL